MEHGIYSIYDLVALEYGPIFQAKNDGVALRSYNQLLAETTTPSEYQLMYLGTFHDGKLVGEHPRVVELNINTEVENNE